MDTKPTLLSKRAGMFLLSKGATVKSRMRENLTSGSVRGREGRIGMGNLHGHEAGNGGYSQGDPEAPALTGLLDVRQAKLACSSWFKSGTGKAEPAARYLIPHRWR